MLCFFVEISCIFIMILHERGNSTYRYMHEIMSTTYICIFKLEFFSICLYSEIT
jgi:hypothetical protein